MGVREKTVEKQREQIEIQREKTTTCIGPKDKEKPMTFEGKIFFFFAGHACSCIPDMSMLLRSQPVLVKAQGALKRKGLLEPRRKAQACT